MEDDTAAKEAQIARQEEAKRVAKVRAGTTRIEDIFSKAFTDDTFSGRRTAYIDYATPQAEDQYRSEQEKLTYALADRGILDSSIRAEEEGKLRQQHEANLRQVAQTGLGYENQARSDVETARAELIRMLDATGDVESVTNQALQRSRMLSQQPAYSPLAHMFTTGSQFLAHQAAEEKMGAASAGMYKPKYDTGLFGSGNVKVT